MSWLTGKKVKPMMGADYVLQSNHLLWLFDPTASSYFNTTTSSLYKQLEWTMVRITPDLKLFVRGYLT